MNNTNIFSENVKLLREQANLSQAELGAAIGISKQTVNDIEHGRSKTTLDRAIILADYFNVPLDYLVGNGIYAYWDKVIEIKPIIIDELIKLQIPEKIINKLETDDNFFLKYIPAIVDKIVFDDTSKEVTIHFFA